MPIEIRELVIRAVAVPEREDVENMADDEVRRQMPDTVVDGRDAIIQECVRQVLKILRQEKER